MKLFGFLLVIFSFGLPALVQPLTRFRIQDQKITLKTSEVLLDVVARNKKGQPATDLTAEEFEIFEDGVKQTIGSMKLIRRSASAGPSNPANTADAAPTNLRTPGIISTDPEVGVNIVALVFDRLSPDARKRAQLAAQSYLGDGSSARGFVGVFAINLSLITIQNYTTDQGLAAKGVERAGSMASSTFDASTLKPGAEEAASARQNAINQAAASAQSGGGGAAGSAAGAAQADQQFQLMQSRMQETFEQLQRDQQGYATTNGLMALVNTLRRLPGRKAVIFFSEGMALPPNVQNHFRSVINAANRANVSVYTVDAAGLRTESTLTASRDEINARSRRRMDNLDRAMSDTSGPLTKNLERNEDLLQLDPQSGLTVLAQETGGAFIGSTNQIGDKLKEIDEELSTFYLLSYLPSNESYDGKFRRISVRVKRSGVDIVARKGYYAVPPTGSSPLFYYEAAPLAALSKASKPKDFPLKIHSLHFPDQNRLGRVAVEIEAPASAFTFVNDSEKKSYSTDFSIVALVRDQNNQVVDKLSHHYSLIGPGGALESVRKSQILFYREITLESGKYEIEAVAYDAISNKASVTRTLLDIPEADRNALRLSSIALIKRVEQVKEKIDSPFRIGEVLVYPNLNEPVSKAAAKQLGFYFNVYPGSASNGPPKLTLEILQAGKSIARLPLQLGAPDETGRIQYASALPLETLGPGAYEMKITVANAYASVSRSTVFRLEP
jgi:VWFA-related protein